MQRTFRKTCSNGKSWCRSCSFGDPSATCCLRFGICRASCQCCIIVCPALTVYIIRFHCTLHGMSTPSLKRMIPTCQDARIRFDRQNKRRRLCGPASKRSRAGARVEDVAGLSLVTEFSLSPHPLVPLWFIYRSKCVLLRFSVQDSRWRPSSLLSPQV